MLAQDTTPGYTDTAAFPATPTRWTYRDIFMVDDARVGQWSKPVTVLMGRGGVWTFKSAAQSTAGLGCPLNLNLNLNPNASPRGEVRIKIKTKITRDGGAPSRPDLLG